MEITTDQAINSFDAGNFAFYRDPGLTMKLESDNLFDQLTPDGKVSIYFAGRDVYLPDIGLFKTHVITDKTFYWDIIDEKGQRTKEGLTSMWISRNENMKIWYGDLIPTNPIENFNQFNDDTAAPEDEPLITANLWFYNSLFLDEYFRYYVILLPKGKTWPDEANAKILPMNDKLHIPKGYYIVGYRPKPEYRYQLATMPIIKSGKEFAIHFQFQLDLEYLFENPTARRYLKIFSSVQDTPRYLLFPNDPRDVIWTRTNEPFISQYKAYLFKYGIQQYLPSKKKIELYENKKHEMFKYSNIVDKLDGLNFQGVVDQLKKKKADDSYQLHSIAAYIYDTYMEWLRGRENKLVVTGVDEIMRYVLFNEFKWNGFQRLYNAVEDIVVVTTEDTDPTHFRPTPKRIIEIDGIKQFEDGWVPKRAYDYRVPPEGYIYAGAVGNGMYLIEINGKPQKVLCDMNNGGWMLIMDGMLVDQDYVKGFVKDNELPEHLVIEDQGVSFGAEDVSEVLFYPDLYFKQAKIGYVDYARECGQFRTEIYSESHMFLFNESVTVSKCVSDLSIDNDVVYSDNTNDQADYYVTKELDEFQTMLTVKMTPGKYYERVRKYVKVIWIK